MPNKERYEVQCSRWFGDMWIKVAERTDEENSNFEEDIRYSRGPYFLRHARGEEDA